MTDHPAVTLYGYPTSPYVLKVKSFLDYKGVDYHWEPVRPVKNEAIKFTGQRKVPVLKIDDEWRIESTDLGLWLDEVFPEKPLLGNNEQERAIILEHDQWVSDSLIAGRFRELLDSDKPIAHITNGWRLAAMVHAATAIPLHWRLMWPFALKKAPFIQDIANGLDRQESIADMCVRHGKEMVQRLQGGPFLGGLDAPSLADLAAFPTLTFAYRAGFTGDFIVETQPAIMAWAHAVGSYLPANPYLCKNRYLTRHLP